MCYTVCGLVLRLRCLGLYMPERLVSKCNYHTVTQALGSAGWNYPQHCLIDEHSSALCLLRCHSLCVLMDNEWRLFKADVPSSSGYSKSPSWKQREGKKLSIKVPAVCLESGKAHGVTETMPRVHLMLSTMNNNDIRHGQVRSSTPFLGPLGGHFALGELEPPPEGHHSLFFPLWSWPHKSLLVAERNGNKAAIL